MKAEKKKTVRGIIVKYSLVLLAASTVCISLITYYYTKNLLLYNTRYLNSNLMASINQNISEILLDTEIVYSLISQDGNFVNAIESIAKKDKKNEDYINEYHLANNIVNRVILDVATYDESSIEGMLIITEKEQISTNHYISQEIADTDKFYAFIKDYGKSEITLGVFNEKLPGTRDGSRYFSHPDILIRSIHDTQGDIIARAIFLLKKDKIETLRSKFNLVILDSSNETMFSSNSAGTDMGKFAEKFIVRRPGGSNGNLIVDIGGKNYFISCIDLKYYNWKLVNFADVDEYYKGLNQIKLYSVYLFAASFAVLFLIYLFSYRISIKLTNILRSFNSILTADESKGPFAVSEASLFRKLSSRMGFSKKILFYFFISIVLPSALLSGISFTKLNSLIDRQALDIVENLLVSNSRSISKLVNDYNRISRYIVSNKIIQSYFHNYPVGAGSSAGNIRQEISKEINKALIDNKYGLKVSLYNIDNEPVYTSLDSFSPGKGSGGNIPQTLRPTWYMDYDSAQKKYNIALARLIIDVKTGKKLGLCKLCFDQEVLANLVKISNAPIDYYILEDESIVVSSSVPQYVGEKFDRGVPKRITGDTETMYQRQETPGKGNNILYIPVENSDWYLCYVYTLDELDKQNLSLGYIYIIFILLISIAVIGVSLRFSEYIINPVNEINFALGELERLNFGVRYERRKGDELDYLSEGFNRMAERLHNLIREIYASKNKEKELELKTLQLQINPHFLYNTLETINSMIDMQDGRACRMICLLSSFFRQGLDRGQSLVKVADEVEYTKIYLEIQKIRYGDMLEIKWICKENVLTCSSPFLILQPIIENCLKHGIEFRSAGGTVRIRIFRAGGKLKFVVGDNGKGMDGNELASLRNILSGGIAGKGVGMINVHERIRFYYGAEYGIKVYSKPEKGSIVIVAIPVDLT